MADMAIEVCIPVADRAVEMFPLANSITISSVNIKMDENNHPGSWKMVDIITEATHPG
jgi:hypothetical protein